MAAANFPDGVQTPTVFGGTTTASQLTLQNNIGIPFTITTNPLLSQPIILRDKVQLLPSSYTQNWAGGTRLILNLSPVVTVLPGFAPDAFVALAYSPIVNHVNPFAGGGSLAAIRMSPIFTWKSVTPNQTQLPTLRLFDAEPTLQTDSPVTGLRYATTARIFFAQPLFTGVQTSYIVDGIVVYTSQGPILNRVAAGSIIHYQVTGNPTLLNGATISTLVGIDIPNFTLGTFTNVGIRSGAPILVGTPNATPSSVSAALEVQSATQALLVSRITTVNRDSMSPLDGMIIYNLDILSFQKYQGGVWVNF